MCEIHCILILPVPCFIELRRRPLAHPAPVHTNPSTLLLLCPRSKTVVSKDQGFTSLHLVNANYRTQQSYYSIQSYIYCKSQMSHIYITVALPIEDQ